MYERRLSGILVLFVLLLGGVGLRSFSLQVLGAGDHVGRLEGRLRPEITVFPRRGEIRYRDGSPMAANEPGFSVFVDFRRFDECLLPTDAPLPRLGFARKRDDGPPPPRWVCAGCCRSVKSDEEPLRCRDCGLGNGFDLAPPADRSGLARVLGLDMEGMDGALRRAVESFRRAPSHRLHPLLARVDRSEGARVALAVARFPGLEVEPLHGRWIDPVAADLVGRAVPPWERHVQWKLHRDALTHPARLYEGKHVYTRAELYRTLVGVTGLERAFDEVLRGVPGLAARERGEDGRFSGELDTLRPVVDGEVLQTTLVRSLQEKALQVVGEAPGEAAAVVLDLADGSVAALASRSETGFHQAVTLAAPGSVFKLVTSLAWLESGGDPAETLDCGGRGYLRKGLRYACEGVHPNIDFEHAFAKSCNFYFMARSEHAGGDALVDACRRLGMERGVRLYQKGSRAGLEYAPGPGAVWPFWNLAHVGIGQGPVHVSPLQIATAYGRVATGGRMLTPFLLERDRPVAVSVARDPVIARHAPLLRRAAKAVIEYGTGRKYPSLRELDACGKSGTAEVPRRDGDGLENNAWFVGFAPADAPRYVAVVVFKRVEGHGAAVCAERVASLLEAAVR